MYGERKRAMSVLDYADLEAFAVRLLAENCDVRARVRDQFQHVLMDEFQDTNGQQSKLLGLLRAPGVFFAVGDVNQSIYGFRHADPEVLPRLSRPGGAGREIARWSWWKTGAAVPAFCAPSRRSCITRKGSSRGG